MSVFHHRGEKRRPTWGTGAIPTRWGWLIVFENVRVRIDAQSPARRANGALNCGRQLNVDSGFQM
jgi:hypothetical protein